MNSSCRIAVADDERDMREYFQEMLPALGHKVVAVAETGRQLIEQCATAKPDLVITDIRMPDMDGLEAAAQLNRDKNIPVVLVSAYHNADYLERACKNHIMAYLIKPVKAPDLQVSIALALSRFEELQKATQEAADLRQALEDRKVIERAKGVVMRRMGLDELEAFRRLRKQASDNNLKLAEVAHRVLHAEETFQALDRS
jgi:response regulator NasT